MKVNNIIIQGVGGIENISVQFNERANIICGPNGIGKTTIIECVSHVFSNGHTSILKRNVNCDKSIITMSADVDGSIKNKSIEFNEFRPENQARIMGLHEEANKVLSFKTTRTFNYTRIDAIGRDSSKGQSILWEEAFNGIKLIDIKNWFVNRYLYSAHEGALTSEQIDNYILAKKCFSILDETISFSRVDAATNEILLSTASGEIYYEYLSSGFKSIIALLFGIIKEIEMRFTEPRLSAINFDGVILIDELELHLHPEWQGKIVDIILNTFPRAQLITTTHSPHIIQAAEPKQIIALCYNEELKVSLRELPDSKYGFKGWTIEEVLTDIMGMHDIRTDLFNSLIEGFQNAIDNNDLPKAKEIYNDVDMLLHPQNNLRKLLKFQLLGLELE